MKIQITERQKGFLIDVLQNEIRWQRDFRDDQLGCGGPSNPETIVYNQRFAQGVIDQCKELIQLLEERREEHD